MPQLSSVAPATEKDAVNDMLASLGEAILPDSANLDTLATTNRDVRQALAFLKSTQRAVLSEGWKFNTRFGVNLSPHGSFNWTDVTGASPMINVFLQPLDVISFRMAPDPRNKDLDMVPALPTQYSSAPAGRFILYDRTFNREGALKTDHPFVYINTTFAMPYEQLPSPARTYIHAMAARRFAQSLKKDANLSGFTSDFMTTALFELKRAEGLKVRANLFENPNAADAFGGRPHPIIRTGRKAPPGGV